VPGVKSYVWAVAALGLTAVFGFEAFGQGPPPARRHTVIESPGKPSLEPATVPPHVRSRVSITVEGDRRVVRANGIPDHDTGQFPNRGNPNTIRQQTYMFDMPAQPRLAGHITKLGMYDFGIAVDGVPFDPGAAEWYKGVRGSKWQYAPLSGAVNLGLDSNYAHVQPTGAYHYHGLPTDLLRELKLRPTAHSPLVGWAADGFPIYAVFGYSNPKDARSPIDAMRSSYRVKSGRRPSGGNNPGGVYDGTFVADYAYVPGLGDLDECNGRITVTPEFPRGTYAYFLSESWPVVPRCYKGTPSKSFDRRPQPAMFGRPPGEGRRHPPPGGFGFPPPRGGPPPRS